MADIAVFLVPVLYGIYGLPPTAVKVCTIATLSALEELVILVRTNDLDPDVRGLFF